MDKIISSFRQLPRNRQRELLSNVCANMIENESWEDIATLLVEQLGPADAEISVQP